MYEQSTGKASCGDGQVDPGELCDDGADGDPDDGCTDLCQLPLCGDGFVQPSLGETCDDAADNDDHAACTSGCKAAACGDGLLHEGVETCDEGKQNADVAACKSDCTPNVCGDGAVFAGVEGCDDGNDKAGDGCEPDCTPTITVKSVALGLAHTCVALSTGKVRCWGYNDTGQLGYGHTQRLGDQPGEMPTPDVDLGEPIAQVVAGEQHTCAVSVAGNVRCWGTNSYGLLGYGHVQPVGDQPGEMPPPIVPVGAKVVAVAAGRDHVCALTDQAKVRCWGNAGNGQLGYMNTVNLGDQPGELPTPDIILGVSTDLLASGQNHNCVRYAAGKLRCWGENAIGQLGYANLGDVGKVPGSMPPMDVLTGGAVLQITGGRLHTCVRLDSAKAKCWGYNEFGQLGYGHPNALGKLDGQMPTPDIPVGQAVTKIVAGTLHTCALTAAGRVRCWGRNLDGELGYGHTNMLGDGPGEMPTPDVDLGDVATDVFSGHAALHTCALVGSTKLRCWGHNNCGQLGYGHSQNVGDDEAPASAGYVPFL